MERTLRDFAGCPIRYAVRDVAEEPTEAEQDQVVFTPTLVKRAPGPEPGCSATSPTPRSWSTS
jgi:hypothetical protein